MNILDADLQKEDFINEYLQVLPAGFRDEVLVQTAGSTSGDKISKNRLINDPYVKILKIKSHLEKYKLPYSKEYIINNFDKEEVFHYFLSIKTLLTDSDINFINIINKEINDLILISIAQTLAGKTGLIRKHTLVKRTNNSGRSVLVPNPKLKQDYLGVPYFILFEWFQEELLHSCRNKYNLKSVTLSDIRNINNYKAPKIVVNEISNNGENNITVVKNKNSITSNYDNVYYDELKVAIEETLLDILKNRRVLAIRFPSLHKYNEQGFKPTISWSTAIEIHPLVCDGYNADFDGDQMSLFLLEHINSIKETDKKLLPSKNINSASGGIMNAPSQEIILGLYCLTMNTGIKNLKVRAKKELQNWVEGKIDNDSKKKLISSVKNFKVFRDYDEMFASFQQNKIKAEEVVGVYLQPYQNSIYKRNLEEIELLNKETDRQEKTLIHKKRNFKVGEQTDNSLVISTVGRFIFNSIIPQDLGFVERDSDPYSLEVDDIIFNYKNGKNISVISGLIKDIIQRVNKTHGAEEAIICANNIKDLGYSYVTTTGISMSIQDIVEDKSKDIIIKKAKTEIEKLNKTAKEQGKSKEALEREQLKIWDKHIKEINNNALENLGDLNPIKMMMVSGSRGNKTQITQLIGARGLMNDTEGKKVSTPILNSFLDGMNLTDIATGAFGARKGIFDRSNRTSATGYLNRILSYSTSDIIITDGDCGDEKGKLEKAILDPKYTETRDVEINPTDTEKILENRFDEILEILNKKYKNNELDLSYFIPEDIELTDEFEITKEFLKDLNPQIFFEEIIPLKELKDIVQGRLLAKQDFEDKRFIPNSPITPDLLKIINDEFGKAYLVTIRTKSKRTNRMRFLDKLILPSRGIRVRSVESCKCISKSGICSRCFGLLPMEQRYTQIGDRAGLISTQTINERATQLTMRTFHTGGAAEGDVTSSFAVFMKLIKNYKYENIKEIEDIEKELTKLDSKINSKKYGLLQPYAENVLEYYINAISTFNKENNILTPIFENYSYNDLRKIVENIDKEFLGCYRYDLKEILETALYNSLERIYLEAGININSIYYKTIVRSMSAFKVIHSGNSIHLKDELITYRDLTLSNLKIVMKGLQQNIDKTTLAKELLLVRGVIISSTNAAKNYKTNPTTAMYFEDLGNGLSNFVSSKFEDNLSNPLTTIVSSNPMPILDNVEEITYRNINPIEDRKNFITWDELQTNIGWVREVDETTTNEIIEETIEEDIIIPIDNEPTPMTTIDKVTNTFEIDANLDNFDPFAILNWGDKVNDLNEEDIENNTKEEKKNEKPPIDLSWNN